MFCKMQSTTRRAKVSSTGMVHSHMFLGRQQQEILGRVVQAIAIYMMNVLRREKFSSNKPGHYLPMFSNPTSIRKFDIPIEFIPLSFRNPMSSRFQIPRLVTRIISFARRSPEVLAHPGSPPFSPTLRPCAAATRAMRTLVGSVALEVAFLIKILVGWLPAAALARFSGWVDSFAHWFCTKTTYLQRVVAFQT